MYSTWLPFKHELSFMPVSKGPHCSSNYKWRAYTEVPPPPSSILLQDKYNFFLSFVKESRQILGVPCCRVLYSFKYTFYSITLGIINLHNKSPNIFACDILGLKFIPICYANAVKDDISPKTICLWLHDSVEWFSLLPNIN